MKRVAKAYMCACNCQGLVLEKWDNNEIGLSIFSRGDTYSGGPLTWKRRLEYIWYIIRTGRPWTDEIILNNETANKVGKELIKLSKETIGKTDV